jgi:hypothetical protein
MARADSGLYFLLSEVTCSFQIVSHPNAPAFCPIASVLPPQHVVPTVQFIIQQVSDLANGTTNPSNL